MEEKVEKLKSFFSLDRTDDINLMFMEWFLAIPIGVFGTFIFTEEGGKATNIIVTSILSILAFILLKRRFRKTKYFPDSVVDDLESSMKLKSVSGDKIRTDAINRFLGDAIKELNDNTCSSNSFYDDRLCDQDLEIGITKVLDSVFKRTDVFLNCNCTRFSVIAQINSCPYKNNDGDLAWGKRAFVLRDDFKISDLYLQSINEEEKSEKGAMYDLYITAKKSYDQQMLSTCAVNYNNQNINVITVSIPNVCNSGSTGVLYLCYEGEIKNLPSDLEQFLNNFCCITTNWISKYADCILSRNTQKDHEQEIEMLKKADHKKTFDMIGMFNKFKIVDKPDEVIDAMVYNDKDVTQSEFIWKKVK